MGKITLRTYSAHGIYYGYPLCCMQDFYKHDTLARQHAMTDKYKFPSLHGKGYIPCDDCYTNKTEEQLLAEIAKHRVCPTTFPEEIYKEGYWSSIDWHAEMVVKFVRRTYEGLATHEAFELLQGFQQELSLIELREPVAKEYDNVKGAIIGMLASAIASALEEVTGDPSAGKYVPVTKPDIVQEPQFPKQRVICDLMYAGSRVRLHGHEDEIEYYVIVDEGEHAQTNVYKTLSTARDSFDAIVKHIMYMLSSSDVSIYSQQKSKPAE